MAKATAYTWDGARWRKNGKFASPPTRGQLRRDTAGRLRDAHGRMVPASALPAPPPKPTAFAWDSTAQRWRKGGKFSARPKSAKQLGKDKRGRPIDARGKRVPAGAIGAPKAPQAPKQRPVTQGYERPKAPPRKPKRPARKPRDTSTPETYAPVLLPRAKPPRTPSGEAYYVPVGSPLTSHELLSSSYENAKDPRYAGKALFNYIRKKAERSVYAPDDITLYQYGVQFVNTSQSGDLYAMQKLIDKLAFEYPMFTILWYENAVTVFMGDTNTPVSRRGAARALENAHTELQDIWGYLADEWDGDIGWFVVAENDELSGKTD